MSYLTEHNLYVVEINSNTILNLVDDIVLVNASGGSVEITLPLASSLEGKEYRIKKIDSSINSVIVKRSGSDTIDGEIEFEIGSQWESYFFISNGTNAYMVF